VTGSLLGVVALIAILLWFVGAGKRGPVPAPEDDIDTPLDRDELAEAEAELAEDPGARSIDEALEDDDWGPGTGGGALPGIM
jgi:predicted small lipoprotein YifL